MKTGNGNAPRAMHCAEAHNPKSRSGNRMAAGAATAPSIDAERLRHGSRPRACRGACRGAGGMSGQEARRSPASSSTENAACEPPRGSCTEHLRVESPSEPPRRNPPEASGASKPPHSVMPPSAVPASAPTPEPASRPTAPSTGAFILPAECFPLTPTGLHSGRPTRHK
jgi:hypothetical protein